MTTIYYDTDPHHYKHDKQYYTYYTDKYYCANPVTGVETKSRRHPGRMEWKNTENARPGRKTRGGEGRAGSRAGAA